MPENPPRLATLHKTILKDPAPPISRYSRYEIDGDEIVFTLSRGGRQKSNCETYNEAALLDRIQTLEKHSTPDGLSFNVDLERKALERFRALKCE